MKSRVNLSKYSSVITCIILGGFIAGIYATHENIALCAILVFCTLILLTAAIFYAPFYISVSETEVSVHSPVKTHYIPMRRIVKAERFQPSMGSIRLCGSGGFWGYWGIFREGDVGRYMAYYGKSSDCFIIYLDNGDKYVLGCNNTDTILEYINSEIKNLNM